MKEENPYKKEKLTKSEILAREEILNDEQEQKEKGDYYKTYDEMEEEKYF